MAIPTALASQAAAAPPGPIQGCMNGGWQTISEPSGHKFPNQGLCIAYAIHHPVSLADLAGSFAGTWSPVNGCGFVGLTFGATYPASSAVGTVTLQIGGCPDLSNFVPPASFNGTFVFTTNVGLLSGTATGQIDYQLVMLPPPFPRFEIVLTGATMTLTATSGTGLFTGISGSLNVGASIGGDVFDGGVTAP